MDKLKKANDYIEKNKVDYKELPEFHVAPQVGWINDPNGFSYYEGMVHLFYQFHPYSKEWGPMHWGHCVSSDLIKWEYYPVALAPDMKYDMDGCFSGSAIETDEGHMLVYTGVTHEENDGKKNEYQNQCVALGDGKSYKKIENNPVINGEIMPQNFSREHFRDPKVWKEDDGYYLVAGNKTNDGKPQVVLFHSKDMYDWRYVSVLAEDVTGKYGTMWECPDFFEINGQYILIASPQDMCADDEFHNGNNSVYFIGNYDRDMHKFDYNKVYALDDGIDFYAPQTMLAPDGRRILIGWMQNLASVNQHSEKEPWFGQMTIPRELAIKKGRLIQRPVRELNACRHNMVSYTNAIISGEKTLKGVCGRIADIELSIAPQSEENRYYMFEMRFAQDDKHYTSLRYHPHESELELDRSYSDSRIAMIHKRSCKVKNNGGKLKLRVVIDRFSAEVFANDGEQVMSVTFTTDTAAKEISFVADGTVYMDIVKYDIE